MNGPDDGLIHVQTLFQAVGEVARSTARTPVEAVLIHAPLANRPLDLVLGSIQRLDPSVMVFLVVEPHDTRSAEQARASGFDGVLEAPVTAAALDAALGGEVSPCSDADENRSVTEAGGRVDDSRQPSAVGDQRSGEGVGAAGHGVDSVPQEIKSGMPGRDIGDASTSETVPEIDPDRPLSTRYARDAWSPSDQMAHSAPGIDSPPLMTPGTRLPTSVERLGDVDVVEAILHDPDRALEMAMRLIRQETGWREVQLLPRDGSETFDAGRSTVPAAPVRFGRDDHGLLVCAEADPQSLSRWAAWLARWLSLAKAQRSLRALAYTDPLTGAWNRRFFDEFMPQAIEHARARRRPLVVMVFDVDDLKTFNDRHGHDAGDRVLRECVRLLQTVIRKGDRVCRIGGDEFAVVFADEEPPRRASSSPVESVEVIARRFQDAICAARLPALGDGSCARLSVSAGLATFPWDASDAQSLLRVADLRAMESKRRGKNALTFGPCAEPEQSGG